MLNKILNKINKRMLLISLFTFFLIIFIGFNITKKYVLDYGNKTAEFDLEGNFNYSNLSFTIYYNGFCYKLLINNSSECVNENSSFYFYSPWMLYLSENKSLVESYCIGSVCYPIITYSVLNISNYNGRLAFYVNVSVYDQSSIWVIDYYDRFLLKNRYFKLVNYSKWD